VGARAPQAVYRSSVLTRPVLVLWASLMAACHAVAPGPPPVLVASTDVHPPEERPPELATVATPGEQMRYRVSIHGLELAEWAIVVGDVTTLDGHEVIVVQTTARTTKVAAWLRPEADEYTSWIDRRSGRPVMFRSVEPEARNSKIVEVVETRFGTTQNQVQVSREDLGVFPETQLLHHAAHDLNSFLMLLRAWEGEVGAQIVSDVTRARYSWRNRTVVAGYDNLDTALGRVAVVRYDGEGQRINRDGSIDPTSDKRRFSIWISDDADRVPIRLVGHTDYGDVILDLQSYEPGRRH